MGAHDSGYKQIFAFPTMVKDLLQGFVKEDWVEALDFDSLERKNGSYISDDLREREDDIIWRVKWRGTNHWVYVYLLIEFQTEHEPFMAVRLLTYVGLLYQDLIRTGEVDEQTQLPPVLPMVVYRGERPWTAPREVRALIGTAPGSLARYQPAMQYLLLEETRMDDAELAAMSNLAAEMFRIEKSETVEASMRAFISFLRWTEKAGAQQDSLKRAIKVWFLRAQKPAKILADGDGTEDLALEELTPMLSERIKKWEAELLAAGKAEGRAEGETLGEAKGRAEGRAEGDVEARKRLAKKLLASGMALREVSSITELSEAELLSLRNARTD